GPRRLEGGVVVAEAARFLGAAGRVVPGVEVEDHPLPPEVGQTHRGAVLVLEGEIGRRVARRQLCLAHSCSPASKSCQMPYPATCRTRWRRSRSNDGAVCSTTCASGTSTGVPSCTPTMRSERPAASASTARAAVHV